MVSLRRNLVIVRAGDASLHPRWLPGSGTRSWDLLVSYFGDDPDRYHGPDVTRIDGKGPKWQALYRLLTEHPDLLTRYDYVWLPDDDIAVSPEDIDRLFATMRRYDLLLAQPALTVQSNFSWCITLQNPLTELRWTNFVETMVPCFRSTLLEQCLGTLAPYISGWGLDWVWPQRAGSDRLRAAILDRVAVTHTRPFGGPNYRFFEGRGYSARDESAYAMRVHGIPDRSTQIIALRSHLGLRLSGCSRLGRLVLSTGFRLIILRAYVTRSPARWDLDKRLTPHLATPANILDHTSEQLPDGSLFEAAQAEAR